MLTWELLGALVGAGFASGREIASFFAQYHGWGYLGALLAAIMLAWLAGTQVPAAWRGHWLEKLWHICLEMLLIATGGAMLAGAGEVMSLLLPLHGANWAGMVFTLVIAWFLAQRTAGGLAWISRSMVILFACVMTAGLTSPKENAMIISENNALIALARGVCYGGFNAALLIPVLGNSSVQGRQKRNLLCCAGAITLILLWTGITVLQKHPGLMYEPMPFIKLLNSYGKFGYCLSAACLYLATLSTLTACIRGLGGRGLPILGLIATSLLGFSRVVDQAYAVLGGSCMLILMAAKFRNCSRKTFISEENML